MGVSDKKYCKCGHEEKSHKGKSKWSITGWCRECPCSSYMNRKRPYKSDYAIMIMMLGFTVFFVGMSSFAYYELDPTLTGIENEPVDMTLGDLYSVFSLMIILVNLIVIFWIALPFVSDVIACKRRREFPISDKDGC